MGEPIADPFDNRAERNAPPRTLRIEFTGSGSEYFRIWIVNLLLILVSFGLYLPFAKARRLRYFYGNTVVDGHALSFHGDPWRMFRGFVLLAVLAGVYSFAGHWSPIAGLFAFCLLAALWPALWRSSLRFRMGNTSWRGLRFSFGGNLADAYKAMLPLYVPGFMLLLPQSLIDPQHPSASLAMAAGLTAAGGLLAMLVMYPLGFALIKRYQHGGYAYAGQQACLKVPTRRFYGLCLKGALLTLVPICLTGVMAAILIPYLRGANKLPEFIGQALVFGSVILFYLALFTVVGPYFAARMQNLVWTGTSSAALRFESKLRFASLLGLTLVNWLLTLVTLSLYRPFAAVRTARLRLEAVSVQLEGDLDTWLCTQSVAEQDASGDAAGDFFGIDLGL